jgi:8-oxo-dGTP diphosphatase
MAGVAARAAGYVGPVLNRLLGRSRSRPKPNTTGSLREVRAAGGVVRRAGTAGGHEVLLVHRPKYGDWTLPKGKVDRGETDREAARREVEEETGLRCELGRELPAVRYNDREGRPKVVRYWEMKPVAGEFVPSAEVDQIRWLGMEQASNQLTYRRDRQVLDALAR